MGVCTLRFQITPLGLGQIPAEAQLELGKNRSKFKMTLKRQRDDSLKVVWKKTIYKKKTTKKRTQGCSVSKDVTFHLNQCREWEQMGKRRPRDMK